ncbi:MAG: DUF1501 domain-containing protein [Pirellula sp.]
MCHGITTDRLQTRQSLLTQLIQKRRELDEDRTVEGYDAFRQRGFSIVTSDKARLALDIRREPAVVRDRYGRHLFGQSVRMSRRLVEAGVRFVTVH